MTDRVLPPGTYCVRVLVVCGEGVDGGTLVQRWVTPARPSLMAEAARKGIGVCVPKRIKSLPKGAWLLIALEFNPGTMDGLAAYGSLQLDADADHERISALLLEQVPLHVEAMASRMAVDFGAFVHAVPRPAQLN